MNLEEIQAVIDSARARGTEALEQYIGERMPETSDSEVREAADLAIEIIETVPIVLATASQEEADRKLASVVQPILDRSARYFLHPMDLLPEMTLGLPGLLDDAYLVLKILQALEEGPDPLLDWDVDHPTAFLRSLLGEKISQQLDVVSALTIEEMAGGTRGSWSSPNFDA